MNSPSQKLVFKGIVQGVGFRPTVYRVAKQLGSHGYVLNKGSEVEVIIDTDPIEFIRELKKDLSPLARIDSIETSSYDRLFTDFSIKQSKEGSKQSLIPVDTAICKDCLHELFDTENRRYHYPFTNCTVCGARYSVIRHVPYDRKQTSMDEFSLCEQCLNEYENPSDRRYHAQTISCSTCGPQYTLYDNNAKIIETDKAIESFAKQLENGLIGVVKSWGGMHLCCTLNHISAFRSWYHRPQKSFAVMVKDINTAKKYAFISKKEKVLLNSSNRPIVLLKKKKEMNIAPGLDYIGLFLPYTPVHYLLFDAMQHDSLIMTSANIPGEPMITKNSEVFKLQANTYLLHNRKIPNRCDDTVIKPWNNTTFFIRKSRGYIPDPIPVNYSSNIVSVGPGENITGAISSKSKLYLTQYIGKSTSYETLDFLEKSIRHLMNLTMEKAEIDAVAMDIHPGYETKLVAKKLAKEFDASLFFFQHHWAHAASLLLDNTESRAVVLSLDGLGYGEDELLWGSEVIDATFENYERIGHLRSIPLIGGDKAAFDPRRILFAIFEEFDEEMYFTGAEAEIFRKILADSPLSTSFGRVLDALSCYLDICCKRTYDGEPAMKLERYLLKGSNRFSFQVTENRGIIDTIDLFYQLHHYRKTISGQLSENDKADLSYSFINALLSSLTHQAILHASDEGINNIGVSGGVSYNIPIVDMIKNIVKKEKMNFLVHHTIPNGDGGISAGQNILAGYKIE